MPASKPTAASQPSPRVFSDDERVAAIVTGAVVDVLDQRLVAAGELEDPRTTSMLGSSSGPPTL